MSETTDTKAADVFELTVPVTYKIPYKDISDLLVCALEGGSNYWIDNSRLVKPTGELVYKYDEDHIYKHYTYPLNEGGAVEIRADDEKEWKRLDLKSIERGIKAMADKQPRHFNDFITENTDATTGDVFLQCCLFGDVIYG